MLELIKEIRNTILRLTQPIKRLEPASNLYWVFEENIKGNPDVIPNHSRLIDSLRFFLNKDDFVALILLDSKLNSLLKLCETLSSPNNEIHNLLREVKNTLNNPTKPLSTVLTTLNNQLDKCLDVIFAADSKDVKCEMSYLPTTDTLKRRAKSPEAFSPKKLKLNNVKLLRSLQKENKPDGIHTRLIREVESVNPVANETSILQIQNNATFLKLNIAKKDTSTLQLVNDIEVIALTFQGLVCSFTPIANLGSDSADYKNVGVAVEKMDLIPLIEENCNEDEIKNSIDVKWQLLPSLATVALVLNNVDFTWKNLALVEQVKLTCFDGDWMLGHLRDARFNHSITEADIAALPNITDDNPAFNWLFQREMGTNHHAFYPYAELTSEQKTKNRLMINRVLFLFSLLPEEFILRLCMLKASCTQHAELIATDLIKRFKSVRTASLQNESFCRYVASPLSDRDLGIYVDFFEKSYPPINGQPLLPFDLKNKLINNFHSLDKEAQKNVKAIENEDAKMESEFDKTSDPIVNPLMLNHHTQSSYMSGQTFFSSQKPSLFSAAFPAVELTF